MIDEREDERDQYEPAPEKVATAWERFQRWLFDEIEDVGCGCGG